MKYKKYLPVFKRCGWNVNVSDNEIEIENWSPAGENIVEYLDKTIDIPSQMQNFAYVWNKSNDYCSEFGTIGIRSFGGGIKRVA